MRNREIRKLAEMEDEEKIALRMALRQWLGSIHQQRETQYAFVRWLEEQEVQCPEVTAAPHLGISASHVTEIALALHAHELPVKVKINHEELGYA